MPTANPDDVNDGMLQRWQQGEDAAARELFDRYAARVWRMAEQQIAVRFKPRFDGDDIVQSVFRTFLRRSREGELDVPASDTLWHLLAAVARNKILRRIAHHRMQRRSTEREQPANHADSDEEADPGWRDLEPTPGDAVGLMDEIQAVLSAANRRDADIFRYCQEGHSTPEIAQLVGCSRWSVRRVLDRLGKELQRRLT
jgi:RNA polymerase sigma-70 factor, ECF subfamily